MTFALGAVKTGQLYVPCSEFSGDIVLLDIGISEICYKYGFESLSNFSHFCRANFGKSPRAIRNERDENV